MLDVDAACAVAWAKAGDPETESGDVDDGCRAEAEARWRLGVTRLGARGRVTAPVLVVRIRVNRVGG